MKISIALHQFHYPILFNLFMSHKLIKYFNACNFRFPFFVRFKTHRTESQSK